MSAFYDQGPLSQIAINLFYGWGYNFYRQENQLRADDQLIRAQVCTKPSPAPKPWKNSRTPSARWTARSAPSPCPKTTA